MRVIAGSYRSRALEAPRGLSTRPTSDRLRETLFNVLAPRIQGAHFADLYAGSGAVGIEAISRGAAAVTFVEKAAPALQILRANLNSLGISGGFRIHAAGVRPFLAASAKPTAERFDIVFLDPPYDAEHEYESALSELGGSASMRLAPGAIVIAEHRRKSTLDDRYSRLLRTRLLQQGDAALSFYVIETT